MKRLTCLVIIAFLSVVTDHAKAKADETIPEFDGGYIKTIKNQYIEMESKAVKSTIYMDRSSKIYQLKNIYYVLDQEGIINMPCEEFKGILIKGQHSFKSFSLHTLSKRVGSDTTAYTPGKEFKVRSKSTGADSYYFQPRNKLQAGKYVAWIGKTFWLFSLGPIQEEEPKEYHTKTEKNISKTDQNIPYTKIVNRAKKLYHQRKFLETIQLLEDIDSKTRKDEGVNQLLAKAYINHAYYESKKGRIDAEGKMDLYKKAHEANPNQPEASYNLACLYARKGQKEKAIKWLKISYPILTQPEHSNLLENIKRDPDLNILREYPGFDEKFPELTGGGYGDDQPSTDY